MLHEESLDASRQRVAFWVAGADETDSLSVTRDRKSFLEWSSVIKCCAYAASRVRKSINTHLFRMSERPSLLPSGCAALHDCKLVNRVLPQLRFLSVCIHQKMGRACF